MCSYKDFSWTCSGNRDKVDYLFVPRLVNIAEMWCLSKFLACLTIKASGDNLPPIIDVRV